MRLSGRRLSKTTPTPRISHAPKPTASPCKNPKGEVEAISLMKPKAEDKGDTGLLEYLEDLIGSNKFITQIEEEGKR